VSEALLTATDVTVTFGSGTRRHAAVRKVSLSVNGGEAIGIVGESGSGKSTLARVLSGLQLPDSGSALYRGRSIYTDGRAYPGAMRREVQMVFQDPYSSLNPRITALAAVAEACRFHDKSSAAEARERALRLLGSMGVGADDARKKPRQLSGGQRQRVSVARALAARPSLLVADEPTSAIDQSAQAHLLNLLNGLRASGLAIILISHDLAVIRYLATRVYVMREGEFVETGATPDVFERPRHPYTQSLIASIPGRRARSAESAGPGTGTISSDQKGPAAT
jgi:ABC-type glutathione transport system ATPase component